MRSPRFIALSGSIRMGSVNKMLIDLVAKAARTHGASVTQIDLKDYPMPIYDCNLEACEGVPENAVALKKTFADVDGFLLACPEYNGLPTPLLKNVIDWVSRPAGGAPSPEECYIGKMVGLFSASPSGLGGLRGLTHMRTLMSNLGCFVHPAQMALPRAGDAFGRDGELTDPGNVKRLETAVGEIVALAQRVTHVNG